MRRCKSSTNHLLEQALGIVQGAKKRKRTRAIQCQDQKPAQRRAALHRQRFIEKQRRHFVGDVAGPRLAMTKMAKSTLTRAGPCPGPCWNTRASGRYCLRVRQRKLQHSVLFVLRAFCCQQLERCGRQGGAGLRIREWACSDCGTVHDRDPNAAENILAARHRRLAEGIGVSSGQ